MRWLIVEDALRDRKGHWFEYVRTFRQGLLALGDSVTVLASQEAESFICSELDAKPVLPRSIWHRMSNGSPLRRILRIPWHGFRTWCSVRTVLKTDDAYDMIFVPTVSIHHLLGWVWLIRKCLHRSHAKVLLYFLSTPIKHLAGGTAVWDGSPTARLLAKLLLSLRSEVASGKVIIGVETDSLRVALSQVAGVPVIYLPQPVEIFAYHPVAGHDPLVFACYGAARYEKGSDLLQTAICRYLKAHPQSQAKFVMQWIDDFRDEVGDMVSVMPALLDEQRLEVIPTYFRDGEYIQRLSRTSAMLLPYRLSSYHLRGSRVVIEAMLNGIPLVTTRGSTLAEQAEEFGAAVLCDDENVESLVAAIETMERSYESFAAKARTRQALAREHFSVKHFRNLLEP